MTNLALAKISSIIERKMAVADDKDRARKSLMESGLYRKDGSLKSEYGGKKK